MTIRLGRTTALKPISGMSLTTAATRRLSAIVFALAVSIIFPEHQAVAEETPKVPVEIFYKIETLIFENLNPSGSEKFDTPVGLNPEQTTRSRTLISHTPFSSGQVQLLPAHQGELNSRARSLSNSSQYKLISHLTWMVKLKDQVNEVFQIPTVTDTERLRELEGYIRVRKGRYLHVKPDLLLTEWEEAEPDVFDEVFGDVAKPVWRTSRSATLSSNITESGQASAETVSSAEPINTSKPEFDPIQPEEQASPLRKLGFKPKYFYKLDKTRRMRSNEVHYLDHPVLGMLVNIQRVEVEIIPEVKEEPEPLPAETMKTTEAATETTGEETVTE